MKERILDVLIYLFDHCIEEDLDYSTAQESLVAELEEAGFLVKDIKKAFAWLEGIYSKQNHVQDQDTGKYYEITEIKTFRMFHEQELMKLSIECQGFLYGLEKYGILNKFIRELIIDRAMALELEVISLEHFKWVALMVIANCNTGNSVEWLEDIIFDHEHEVLH